MFFTSGKNYEFSFNPYPILICYFLIISKWEWFIYCFLCCPLFCPFFYPLRCLLFYPLFSPPPLYISFRRNESGKGGMGVNVYPQPHYPLLSHSPHTISQHPIFVMFCFLFVTLYTTSLILTLHNN